MERFVLSRRALLGGVGALGVASLLPRTTRAQSTLPKRLIVVHVPEGMWSKASRPTPGATTLGPLFSPLDRHLAKLNVLNGLAMPSRDNAAVAGDGHNKGVINMLTAIEMPNTQSSGGPSFDQKIAAAISSDSQRVQSLQLGVRIVYTDNNSKLIWGSDGIHKPAVEDPWKAYSILFDGYQPPTTDTSTAAAPVYDMRKSVLDHALSDINRLRARLPSAAQLKLDEYQTSLRSLEKTLGSTASLQASCTVPNLGEQRNDYRDSGKQPDIGAIQMDLAVAALQCDITRVVSLQWGNSNDQSQYEWLGINAYGHALSHNTNYVDPDGEKKVKVVNWYAEQFASLLDRLEAVKEGNGTMLDSTAVLWVSEFGESNGHASNNLLWLLAGNLGGQLKTGQVLDLGGDAPINNLFVTLQNAFGIADTTFGNAAYCSGGFSQLLA